MKDQERKQIVWTQWSDLEVPAEFTLRSPADTPLESGDLSEITFYVPPYMTGRASLEATLAMDSLQTLQVLNAGYDDALEFVRPGVTLCNGRGIHDASTAELAVGLAIASLRGFASFTRSQDKGQWEPARFRSINDSKIGIVGFGSIGKRIARNLAGFDVEVIGFSQSGSGGSLPIEQLDSYLPSLDIVILILPLTQQSRHLFDARRLALLKNGALLINVARGGIIDTDALLDELNSGRITAALDVTDPEPLPDGHALWSAPGVFISPHVGGNSSAFEPRARQLVEEQLKRLAAGVKLENIIIEGVK